MTVHHCAIAAGNYLPRALTLFRSLRAHQPTSQLTVLVLDGSADHLPPVDGLSIITPGALPIDGEEFLDLAAIYDVVELATAMKPLLLETMVREHGSVAYLDPDMYVVSPLEELATELDASGGVLLTPHFLHPIEPDSERITEVHCLTVGYFNLGFCATNRSALPFLHWWWGHLRNECLDYPLLGLFVDQKWVDVGSRLFPSSTLGHPGYNIGPWNVHERRLEGPASAPRLAATQQPARLLHFSGFDAADPRAYSSRLNIGLRGVTEADETLARLCVRYADDLRRASAELGPLPPYRFATDTTGRRLSTPVRRAFRKDRLDGLEPPSPFRATAAADFDRWRRSRRLLAGAQVAADAAIAAKYVFPDQYRRITRLAPHSFRRVRAALLRSGRVRR